MASIEVCLNVVSGRTEEADDDPSHRHHTWSSGVQAILEETVPRGSVEGMVT